MKLKKLLILGFLTSLPFLTHSQTDSTSTFPSHKDFALEINFNPFGSEGVFSFDMLQTKYWINDKTAFRLGLQFDYKKNTNSDDEEWGMLPIILSLNPIF